MNGLTPSILFFCLAAGAAMGCLFLLFQGVRRLFGAGKELTFLLDLVFGCLCGAFVFLCALAVDRGRLRLYQAILHSVGAWAAISSGSPLVLWGFQKLHCFFCKVWRFLKRGSGFLRGHLPAGRRVRRKTRKKTEKKQKKERKKT